MLLWVGVWCCALLRFDVPLCVCGGFALACECLCLICCVVLDCVVALSVWVECIIFFVYCVVLLLFCFVWFGLVCFVLCVCAVVVFVCVSIVVLCVGVWDVVFVVFVCVSIVVLCVGALYLVLCWLRVVVGWRVVLCVVAF